MTGAELRSRGLAWAGDGVQPTETRQMRRAKPEPQIQPTPVLKLEERPRVIRRRAWKQQEAADRRERLKAYGELGTHFARARRAAGKTAWGARAIKASA